MQAVAANVLTGFLGSGKTTLLKHVLENGFDDRRVAIVMNELGEIGIDGKVITGLKSVERMVEVSSGCICCSVGTQFEMGIREILTTAKPHLVIIESTGVAEPFSLIQRVREAGLTLDAVITVVDAGNVERYLQESEVGRLQIQAADFLVLNKLDLVDERGRKAVERRLKRINPRALVHGTKHGAIEGDLVFGTSVRRYREQARDETGEEQQHAHPDHLHTDGINAFLYRGEPEERFLRDRFERFLGRLHYDIYRAKGIVLFEGESSPCLFNYTCGRFEIEWFKPPSGVQIVNQAVFIGREARKHEERTLSALRRCLPGQSRMERLLGRPS